VLFGDRSILVGDLNIAPLEHDVSSHKSLLSVVSHTTNEVDKLDRAHAAGPWVDALPKFGAGRGGVIARPIGRRPTTDGGWIIFGSARRSAIP
jgi:hypothetical protein